MLKEGEQDSIPQVSQISASSAQREDAQPDSHVGDKVGAAGESDEAYNEAMLGVCTVPVPQDEEPVPMIDVHAPHEGIHNWRQYMLHMSTIVLGLLIAIGLEQSVESMHRARERAELRESLRREAEKAIADAEGTERAEKAPIEWLDARQRLIKDALATHKPLTGLVARAPHVSSTLPIDPAWNAAKESGLLPLLTQEEVQVYSQADSLFVESQQALNEGVAAARRRGSFESRHSNIRNMEMMDASSLSPGDLSQYLDLVSDELIAWDHYRVMCQYVRGTETAILGGERDLSRAQKAMYRFYSRTPK